MGLREVPLERGGLNLAQGKKGKDLPLVFIGLRVGREGLPAGSLNELL
jgi:hypothetical protein